SACGFPTNPGCLLDAAQRPAKSAESEHLVLFLFVQDVGHAAAELRNRRLRQRLSPFPLAGFEVTTYGRFSVTAAGRRGTETTGFLRQGRSDFHWHRSRKPTSFRGLCR